MKVNLQAEKLSKYFSVFLLLFGVATLSYAQRTELGFGIGGLNYTGDLVRNYNFKFIKPAATGLFRANLNKALSFRASIVAGQLGADDTTQPIDRFAVSRDSSFTANGSSSAFDIFLFEASAVMEYHFLDWRSAGHLTFLPVLRCLACRAKGKSRLNTVISNLPFHLGWGLNTS